MDEAKEGEKNLLLSSRVTRSVISPRAEPCSSRPDKRHVEREVKCIICDQISYKKKYSKSRIEKGPRASDFLKAVKCLRDDVFERVADILDEGRLFGSDRITMQIA